MPPLSNSSTSYSEDFSRPTPHKNFPIHIFIKRLFDILVSALSLIVLSPFLLIISVFIYLDSPGNVLFCQQRVGKNGKYFNMWKFRSMHANAEQLKAALMNQNEMTGGVLFKMRGDPRITRMGRIIRKFSIDEIPQLWNVLIGDMSLVGPRPPLPVEVEQYSAYEFLRLAVTPGITCIWQISGRSEIPFQQQVELDLHYIATQSFWTDIVILLKTIPAVISGRGAY
jgi:exopolysaccharide biosynthesis polyprenyl glycosylphosphotransferase